MTKIIFTLLLLLIHGICHADSVEDAKNRAAIVSITDAVTTAVALSNGATDLNPIIGSNPGMVIPITAFKFFIIDKIATSDNTDQVKKFKLDFITSIWGGASINNFLILAGMTSPASLLLGAVGGYMIYDTVSAKPI
jgi:hypothetical protein